jgi:hypothetical protein
LDRDFKIESQNNKYLLYCSQDFWGELHKLQHTPNKNIISESYQKLAKYFSKYFSENITGQQLWEFINSWRRKNYFEGRYYHRDIYKNVGLLKYRVIGSLDGNNDGVNDILMYRRNERWIASQLILYDFKNAEIVWKREMAQYIPKNFFRIVDLDQDGKKEILIKTYSSCSEMPVEWFKNPNEMGYTTQARFFILTNEGKIKTINGKKQLYNYEKNGFYEYNNIFLPEWNKIILGLRVVSDFSEKKIEYIDLQTGLKYETEIPYTSIIGIKRQDDTAEAYNLDKGILERIEFDANFNIQNTKFATVNEAKKRLIPGELYLKGERYISLQDMIMLDNGLNIVLKPGKAIHSAKFVNNKLIYIDSNNRSLSIARFDVQKELNPWALIILLAELILILASILIVHIIKLPHNSIKKSYFVIFSILHKLYYWQIKGDIKHYYKLPKKIAFSEKIPQQILHEISNNHKQIIHDDYLIFSYKVFELSTFKALQIIQVLTHDLKNDILLHKMQIHNFLKERGKDSAEEVLATADEISKAAVMLSNFMHINKMYKEEVKINLFMENLEANYINDGKYELLGFENRCYSEYFYVDNKLLSIAIKNLINNAMKEIDKNGYVKVVFKEDIENHYIRIENPTNLKGELLPKFKDIGFTTKAEGSGIGIPIALEIVENHKGKLNFYLIDGVLRAEIVIPNKW